MNRKQIVLAVALAISISGIAAASVHTGSDVRGVLGAQGYLVVSNIHQVGDTWFADAVAPGTKHIVKVQIDSLTGVVSPDDSTSEKSPLDIFQSIQSAGYSNIGAIRFTGGVWKANAVSSTGESVNIKVDPSDGNVIEVNPQ
jgi:hypothetical protein